MSFFLTGSISPALWAVCKLILYVFCVVDLVLLAVAINIATFAWWRCLRIVRRAELLWDKDPDRAERLCYRVRNRLDRLVRVNRARRLAKLPEVFKVVVGCIFVESALLFVEVTDWSLASLEAAFKSLRQHVDIPKYHRSLRAVARFVDEDPWRVGAFSRRVCEKCEDMLSHRLVKRELALIFLPANSTRLSAYALSEVLVAVQQSRKGQYRLVEARLDKIRKRFGQGPDADRWLGAFYLASGHTSSEAVECYLRLCKSKDGATDSATVRMAKQRLQVACEIRSGMSVSNLEERLQWNRRAAEVIVDQSWPLLGEGLALYGLKRYAEATAALERTSACFPKCTEARLWTARCHAAMGDKDQARRQLVSAARGARGDSSVLVALAEHFLAIGQTKAAQELVDKLPLTNTAIKGKLLAIEGKLRLRRGKVEKAIRSLQKAYQLAPDDIEVPLALAEAWSSQGEHARALQLLRSVVSERAQDPRQMYAMACALWNSARHENAIEWFERCSPHGYRNGDVAILWARSLIKLARYDDAIQVLRSAKDLSKKEAVDIAFYCGVALNLKGRPAKAQAYFTRAANLARKVDDASPVVLRRAERNIMACYGRIAEENIQAGKYLQAAKALELLCSNSSDQRKMTRWAEETASQCYVHAAVEWLRKGHENGPFGASALLEKAIALRPSIPLKTLLGGSYARQHRYKDAVETYQQILRESPSDESPQFALAFCMSRDDQLDAGRERFRRILGAKGQYAIQAALEWASAEAAENRHEEAAATLLGAVRVSGAKQRAHYGNACCHAVLATLRSGHVEEAKQLAEDLFSEGCVDRPETLIGALLAHEGHHDEALRYLESGVAHDDTESPSAKLLSGIYRQVAVAGCLQGDFDAATVVLGRAVDRFHEPEMQTLSRLATATGFDGGQEITEEILQLLKDVFRSSPTRDASIVRDLLVAHQQVAYRLTCDGRHSHARGYWNHVLEMFQRHIRSDSTFWDEYIENYNKGKHYKLTCTGTELQQVIYRSMAAMLIALTGEALQGPPRKNSSGHTLKSNEPLFDVATFFWKHAKRLVGELEAIRLFEEIVNVNELQRELAPKGQPAAVAGLFRWLCHQVIVKKEYTDALANASWLMALEALTQRNVPHFLRHLETVGANSPDLEQLIRQIRLLGEPVISSIVREFRRHPIGKAIAKSRPDMLGQAMWLAISGLAQSTLPMGFGPEHIRLVIDDLMKAVAQAMKGK